MIQLHEPGTLRTTAEFELLIDHVCVDDGKVWCAKLVLETGEQPVICKQQLGPELMARLQREYDEEMKRQREAAIIDNKL